MKKIITYLKSRNIRLQLGIYFLIILLPISIYLLRNPLFASADSHLKFDEGSGTTIHDSSGSASGTITNATWKPESECPSGPCLYFDGTGDYVSFGDDSSFDFAAATNFTIEFWFRTTDITTGTRVFVSKYRGDDTEGGYKVFMSSDGKVNFGVDDDNSFGPDDIATSVIAYDDDLWHHVVATKTGTTNLTLYIDAQQVHQDVSISANGTLVNDDPLAVGIDANLSSNPYTGYIDEVKIYVTTARSADQVITDFQQSSTTTGTASRFGPDSSFLSDGLVGYWKMDNGVTGNAQLLTDSSGNSNTAISRYGTNAAGMSCTGIGKYGYGCAFDGLDDRLTVGYRMVDIDHETGSLSQYTMSDNDSGDLSVTTAAALGGTGYGLQAVIDDTNVIYASKDINSTANSARYRFYLDPNTFTSTNQQMGVAGIRATATYLSFIELNYTSGTHYLNAKILTDSGANWGTTAAPITNEPHLIEVYAWRASSSSSANGGFRWWIDGQEAEGRSDVDNYDYWTGVAYFRAGAGLYTYVPSSATGTIYIDEAVVNTDNSPIGVGLNNTVSDSFTASTWFKYTGSTNPLVNINHETNDFSQYSSSSTDGGDLSISSAAALSGTGYGLSALIDDLNAIYARKGSINDTSGTTKIRFIFDPNSITMPNSSDFYFLLGYNTAGTTFVIMRLGYTTAGGYSLSVGLKNDASSWTNSSYWIVSDAPHVIELYVKKSTTDSSNDAYISWTIDGVSYPGVSGVDCFTMYSSFNQIDLGALGTMDSGDDGTIFFDELVINNTSAVIGSPQKVLLNKFEATGSDGGYQLQMEADGDITASISDSNTIFPKDSVTSTAATYDDGDWHHATMVKNADTNLQLFIDGQLIGTDTAISSIATLANNDTLSIGIDNNGWDKPWLGSLDETRLYNRALSPSEVDELYTWAPGPVGYWKMDENTGQYAYDSSGNGLTLTLGENSSATSTDPSWSAGKFGNSLQFDGTSDYARMSDHSLLTPENDMTLTFWFKLDTLASVAGRYLRLVSKNHSVAPYDSYICYMQDSTDQLNCSWFNTAGTEWTDAFTTFTPVVNQWYFASFVKRGATTELRINNIADANGGYTNLTGTMLDSDYQLAIGANISAYASFLDGQIDEIKLYNYARSDKQIIQDMNADHPTPGSPVGSALAEWRFDEGATTVGYDSSNNGYNLTIDTTSDIERHTADGYRNHGLYSNGTYGSAAVSSSSFVFGANSMTLSIWAKSASATNPGTSQYLFARGAPSSAGYAIYYDTDGKVVFAIDDDATWTPDDVITGVNDFYDGNWHHIVAVKTDTSSIKLYVDGILEAQKSGLTASGSIAGSTALLFAKSGAGTLRFIGTIDEASVYAAALDADQVKILNNNGKSSTLGSYTTDASGNVDNSQNGLFCIPGDATTCSDPQWGYYPLDEQTGTTSKDLSSNDQKITFAGTPKWVPGKFGSAILFNGSTDYLSAVSSGIVPSAMSNTSQFTISAWVKLSSLSNLATVVSKRGNANNKSVMQTGSSTFGGGTNDAVVDLRVTASTPSYGYTTGDIIKTGEWQHWEMVFDGTQSTNATRLKFFLDGQPQTLTFVGTIPATTVTSVVSVLIGAESTTTNFLNGIIDDVRIYNYPRSAAQVAWDYNRGGPIAHYKLDECIDATAYNSAVNANGLSAGINGTINYGSSGNTATGTCGSGTTTHMWNDGTNGKFNGSLGFDGTDDYVSLGDQAMGDLSQSNYSVSAWIKTSDTANDQVILSQYRAGVCGAPIFEVAAPNGYLYWYDGASEDLVGTTPVTDGSWHHAAAVGDGTYTTIYLDGKLHAQRSFMAWSNCPTADVRIGARQDATYPLPFNGQLDDVRIYKYPLTLTQIQTIYNGGAAVRF